MRDQNTVKLRKLLSKLVLLVALAMMISSAMISYFFVRQNEPRMSALKNDAQSKQALIRDVWSNITKKENRADMAIILSAVPAKDKADIQTIKKSYLIDFPELTADSSMTEIIIAVKKDAVRNGEYIDNLYLEQAAINKQLSEIEAKNKLYSDIAFFLQILSLVLIILRKDFPE